LSAHGQKHIIVIAALVQIHFANCNLHCGFSYALSITDNKDAPDCCSGLQSLAR
jgi:hypothetical protein